MLLESCGIVTSQLNELDVEPSRKSRQPKSFLRKLRVNSSKDRNFATTQRMKRTLAVHSMWEYVGESCARQQDPKVTGMVQAYSVHRISI